MSAKLSNLVLKEYTKILKTGEFSDVEILVGEKQNTKTFHLHSLILKVCSPYFRIFEILINYIYSGKLELAKNDIKTIIELLIAADELCLNELCSYIEKYLLNDKESLKSNFILILNTIEKYDQFTILSQFCKTSCRKDPSIVFRADDFVTIGQECFLEFLTKYSDSLKQIEVWNKLTEWAIAKSNNELPSDATMWTIDNITTFGTLIQPFISHINFQKVSSIDFITKIKPFKSIFDDKFYNKIVEDHCLNADLTSPQIVKYLDSQIINLRDASLICNWIKAMKKQKWEVTYDFDLLVVSCSFVNSGV
ncbi:unnamed protein product [Rhizophagus irregularis]|uniref:BTB domain-containing protein n=1 Tax=Rhizophagus irregularis TaxID=588596 RepID=A0A916E859_9GLOM|nr:unnamed protein product [Rhizophagus irregularis]